MNTIYLQSACFVNPDAEKRLSQNRTRFVLNFTRQNCKPKWYIKLQLLVT